MERVHCSFRRPKARAKKWKKMYWLLQLESKVWMNLRHLNARKFLVTLASDQLTMLYSWKQTKTQSKNSFLFKNIFVMDIPLLRQSTNWLEREDSFGRMGGKKPSQTTWWLKNCLVQIQRRQLMITPDAFVLKMSLILFSNVGSPKTTTCFHLSTKLFGLS